MKYTILRLYPPPSHYPQATQSISHLRRLLHRILVRHAQPTTQLIREPLIALFAHRLLIVLEELGLLRQLRVAHGARKMVHTPRLVQRRKHIAGNHLIAHKAQVPEQLMVVNLAVGQAALLVVAIAQERLLAFGAHEMLDVPVLAQRRHDALLDRAPACAANRYAHFVVTPQAVQLVHVVGRESRTGFHLACGGVQFDVARRALEVVAVVDFAAEAQRRVVDDAAAEQIEH